MNLRFENDVKTYSIQTILSGLMYLSGFENDVKTYSIQTIQPLPSVTELFENDVKTYSIQTILPKMMNVLRLRMM